MIREMILVSACLLGENCRYDGGNCRSAEFAAALEKLEGFEDFEGFERFEKPGGRKKPRILPVCPEVLGGLPVPRPRAEIITGNDGEWPHTFRKVFSSEGADLTDAFERGARATLDLALANGTRIAVLKDGSPSCGRRSVYDGTFSGKKREGMGIASQLLVENGVTVFTEREWIDEVNEPRS